MTIVLYTKDTGDMVAMNWMAVECNLDQIWIVGRIIVGEMSCWAALIIHRQLTDTQVEESWHLGPTSI